MNKYVGRSVARLCKCRQAFFRQKERDADPAQFFIDLILLIILAIDTQFHMDRSKAIFDWIFGIDATDYELYYFSSANTGLSDAAIAARRKREASSLRSVQKLSQTYRTMADVWIFINTQHDLYAASKLVQQRGSDSAKESNSDADELVKKSYGAT